MSAGGRPAEAVEGGRSKAATTPGVTLPVGSEPRVRVVVDRADAPGCGLALGDFFEVSGSTLTIPSGKPFCLYAMSAVFSVLGSRLEDLPEDHWLERKPWICCPDPREGVVMRLDRMDRPAVDEVSP